MRTNQKEKESNTKKARIHKVRARELLPDSFSVSHTSPLRTAASTASTIKPPTLSAAARGGARPAAATGKLSRGKLADAGSDAKREELNQKKKVIGLDSAAVL
jgi:hypothetical protein